MSDHSWKEIITFAFSMNYNFLNTMADQNKGFITKPVFIASGLIGLCLYLFILFIQYVIFPNLIIGKTEKFQVVITQVTSAISPSPQVTLQTNDQFVRNTPSIPGVIALGMKLIVYGTGNDGLRMHSDPGINQQTLFLAKEGEEIIITDGPVITDGLIWWKINVVNDSTRIGWSVQDYLREMK
jgi:hypothetical protein